MILYQTNKIPSQHDLIPNLGVLDRLLVEESDKAKVSSIQRVTEQLPYYLRGAFSALQQMELARVKAIECSGEISGAPSARIVLPADKIDPLSFALDFYLFCSKRACDSIVSYISRCPNNISLPESISDLIIGLEKSKWSIDSIIQNTLLEFWESVGKRLRDYRDQVSHKAIILSNCVAFEGKGGVKALSALLPDNPEEKSPSKIGYEPGVPLMGFSLDSFAQTVHMINVLVERMIDLLAPNSPDARAKGIVAITMRGAPFVVKSTISGEPVPYPTNIQKLISRAAERKYGFPKNQA